MATNENIDEAIDHLKGLLNEADLDELKSLCKKEYSRFWSLWKQCDRMTRLENYNTLKDKIKEIKGDGNRWFYIGYTNKLTFYLWDKVPNSQIFQQRQPLVKSHTYYAYLRDSEGENQHALIGLFQNHARLLNDKKYGIKDGKGIVYVLFFNPGNPQ